MRALGIPRDWHAGVGRLGRRLRGDGVGTCHLAGRTLAALIPGRDDPATALPWVGHWKPEPLRCWVNAGLRLMTLADAQERLTRRPSVVAAFLPGAGG